MYIDCLIIIFLDIIRMDTAFGRLVNDWKKNIKRRKKFYTFFANMCNSLANKVFYDILTSKLNVLY